MRTLIYLLLLTVVFSQTVPISGGYNKITDFNNPNLQDILLSLSLVAPQTSDWTLLQAWIQLVNGLNFNLIYQVNQTTKANVTAYMSFKNVIDRNTLTIKYYQINSNNSNNSTTNNTSNNNTNNNTNNTKNNSTNNNNTQNNSTINACPNVFISCYESQSCINAVNIALNKYPSLNQLSLISSICTTQSKKSSFKWQLIFAGISYGDSECLNNFTKYTQFMLIVDSVSQNIIYTNLTNIDFTSEKTQSTYNQSQYLSNLTYLLSKQPSIQKNKLILVKKAANSFTFYFVKPYRALEGYKIQNKGSTINIYNTYTNLTQLFVAPQVQSGLLVKPVVTEGQTYFSITGASNLSQWSVVRSFIAQNYPGISSPLSITYYFGNYNGSVLYRFQVTFESYLGDIQIIQFQVNAQLVVSILAYNVFNSWNRQVYLKINCIIDRNIYITNDQKISSLSLLLNNNLSLRNYYYVALQSIWGNNSGEVFQFSFGNYTRNGFTYRRNNIVRSLVL